MNNLFHLIVKGFLIGGSIFAVWISFMVLWVVISMVLEFRFEQWF